MLFVGLLRVSFEGTNLRIDGLDLMLMLNILVAAPFLAEYRMPDPLWCHMDFLFARQVGRYVNGPILGILKRYPIVYENGRRLEVPHQPHHGTPYARPPHGYPHGYPQLHGPPQAPGYPRVQG